MHPRTLVLAAALVLPLSAPGCGRDAQEGAAAPGAPLPPLGRSGPSEGGLYVAQEIWLTYTSEEFQDFGHRRQRPKQAALELATSLRERVQKGEDPGLLAQEFSDAPGARAEGYFASTLPVDPQHPDARDQALASVREGQVTPLVEWRGGWWFARRISPAAGRRFEQRFRMLVEEGQRSLMNRVRARAIVLPYVGSYPYLYNVTATVEQAQAVARGYIAELVEGAASFAALGAKESWDGLSSGLGAELVAFDPKGRGSRWIWRYDEGYPDALLEVMFSTPVGLVAQPIVTVRGVVVLEILERRKVTDADLAPVVKLPGR